jgi:hypothetical protein
MTDTWYLIMDGQQQGPLPKEQVQQLAQEQRVTSDTMVWSEGMANWQPASQIPGLLSPAPTTKDGTTPPSLIPTQAQTDTLAMSPSSVSPYSTPRTALAHAPTGTSYPLIAIKPANFALWMWSFIGAFLCIPLLLILLFFAVASSSSSSPQTGSMGAASILGGVALYVLCLACFALSGIFFYINLYRAWSCLAAGMPSTSPGKAVGFLFIPLFNLYWMFVAIAGLPRDWNRIVASYDDLKNAPRMNESIFLMFCIGSLVFPPLSLIVMFPMMSQICQGINFFARRRN